MPPHTVITSYSIHYTKLYEDWADALFDALLLTLLMIPAVHILLLRPLSREIMARRQAELELNQTILHLRQALEEVNTLRGILPICSRCKKIRDDEGFWHQLEAYFSRHTGTSFTHVV